MAKVSAGNVLRGLCPQCGIGKVSTGFLNVHRRCPHCGMDLYPEPGYYLGAMMAGFLISAAFLIPTIIILKVSGADPTWVLLGPILQYVIFAPVITYYAKILWLHLEYHLSDRWNQGPKK